MLKPALNEKGLRHLRMPSHLFLELPLFNENLEFCIFRVDYLKFVNVETLYAFFKVS